MQPRRRLTPAWIGLLLFSSVATAQSAEPVSRVLPPPGIEIPANVRQELTERLEGARKRAASLTDPIDQADTQVYLKALELALHYGEFYGPKDFDKARFAASQVEQRLDAVEQKQAPWRRQAGVTVRGYLSRIDGSAQPYGVVTAKDHDFAKPSPLYVWLHGRGDKQTDLHFIHERHHGVGQIAPPGAIVIHPFGRHCLGFKSAGEIDVLEAVAHAQTQYQIDPNRIVLAGFSMGGAGAWHLGAHYADRWCAVSPGAGFAETARYVKLTPDKYPPMYEQLLWGCYDVPAYVRNLFNVPVVAYSGEKDKQIQAAQVMEEAFAAEGKMLRHLIGPGVEHKYNPETLKQLLSELAAFAQQGRNPQPLSVSLQTRTLRYGKLYWVEALGLEQHWRDSRVDAAVDADGVLTIATRNVTSLRVTPPKSIARVVVDGKAVPLSDSSLAAGKPLELSWNESKAWSVGNLDGTGEKSLRKRPGLQGPIDDAFLEPFLFIVPSGQSSNKLVEQWVQAELAHARDRWQAVCRGSVVVRRDDQVTAEDIASRHLVIWGDPSSNKLLARIADRLPIRWREGQLARGDQKWSADSHVPVLIYPNPENPSKYVVINSGLTFRESHDRTNSQQNPKLPDWAVLDVRQPADGQTAGKVVEAGFWNEQWR
jgi:predicted esterase